MSVLRSTRSDDAKLGDMLKARRLAKEAHGDQKRSGGQPYTLHLARVAHAVALYGWETEAVAWLHDIIEDTEVTAGVLQTVNRFDPELVKDVVALTRRTTEPYTSYIVRVAKRPRATVVKFYDILDNLGDNPSKGREAHYREALSYLAQKLPRGERRP